VTRGKTSRNPDLREQLAEQYRQRVRDYAKRLDLELDPSSPPEWARPWLDRAAALDAGEPVAVQGWELPLSGLPHPRPRPYERVIIEPDGSVSAAETRPS
jgi:hypothetical protein